MRTEYRNGDSISLVHTGCARDNNMTCPNCGREGDPDESVTAGIRYFNCPTCDFSTWDQAEYLWSVNH